MTEIPTEFDLVFEGGGAKGAGLVEVAAAIEAWTLGTSPAEE